MRRVLGGGDGAALFCERDAKLGGDDLRTEDPNPVVEQRRDGRMYGAGGGMSLLARGLATAQNQLR